MNILMVGDVYGEPGRQAVAKVLPRLRQEHAIDFAVVNVENAAGGFGVTAPIARQILEAGAHGMTSGNPTWGKPEVVEYITQGKLLVFPAHFSTGKPRRGHRAAKTWAPQVAVPRITGRAL